MHALVGYAQVMQVRGDDTMAEEMYGRATDFHERNVAALIHKVRHVEGREGRGCGVRRDRVAVSVTAGSLL